MRTVPFDPFTPRFTPRFLGDPPAMPPPAATPPPSEPIATTLSNVVQSVVGNIALPVMGVFAVGTVLGATIAIVTMAVSRNRRP